jgi:hypothetical protein
MVGKLDGRVQTLMAELAVAATWIVAIRLWGKR